jgi:hypothetical protein
MKASDSFDTPCGKAIMVVRTCLRIAMNAVGWVQ